MIAKFNSSGRGSGSAPVNYLLGADGNREGAELLSGDPKEISNLIDSSPFVNKYTSGGLYFKESDLSPEKKEEIMKDFEKTLLPNLDKNNYSILWVQHRDKDLIENGINTGEKRLELNFIIPNTELQSGKRLQPYYHAVDEARVDTWKDLINEKYDLESPNDLSKQQLSSDSLNTKFEKNLETKQIKDVIHNAVQQSFESGEIENREDVIGFLTSNDINVSKVTKNFISIENPNQTEENKRNIRLKGAFYRDDFTNERATAIRELPEKTETETSRADGEREARIEKLEQSLQRSIDISGERNNKLYKTEHGISDITTEDLVREAREIGKDIEREFKGNEISNSRELKNVEERNSLPEENIKDSNNIIINNFDDSNFRNDDINMENNLREKKNEYGFGERVAETFREATNGINKIYATIKESITDTVKEFGNAIHERATELISEFKLSNEKLIDNSNSEQSFSREEQRLNESDVELGRNESRVEQENISDREREPTVNSSEREEREHSEQEDRNQLEDLKDQQRDLESQQHSFEREQSIETETNELNDGRISETEKTLRETDKTLPETDGSNSRQQYSVDKIEALNSKQVDMYETYGMAVGFLSEQREVSDEKEILKEIGVSRDALEAREDILTWSFNERMDRGITFTDEEQQISDEAREPKEDKKEDINLDKSKERDIDDDFTI